MDRLEGEPGRHINQTRWGVLNALVDVAMRELGEVQLRVWLIYYRHADRDNVARIGTKTVADKLGHKKTTHAHDARNDLIARGFLQVLEQGGPGSTMAVRVLAPETTPTQGIPGAGVYPVPETGYTRRRGLGYTPPPGPEQNIEHNQTNTTARDSPAAGAVGGGGGAAVLEELRRCGVLPRVAAELANRPGLTPVLVRLAYRRALDESKGHPKSNPPALLAKWLRDGTAPPPDLSPKAVCALVNAGEVVRVCGLAVAPGTVGQNGQGLHVYRRPGRRDEDRVRTIATPELTPAAIELGATTTTNQGKG